MLEYNKMELMITVAAREFKDGDSIAVGTGAPCAAVMLANKIQAPNLLIMFEAGGINPDLPEMPISVGDSRTFNDAIMAGGMVNVMDACARGLVDYAFLGGAQIDMYGNLNSTIIGENYLKPKVRLPGSGGAGDFGSYCWRMMAIMPQDKRRFVEKVDFVTTPGWLKGGESRSNSGLPKGTGPYKIVTNMGVMDFERETKRMRVNSINPGYSFQDIQENCGFELLKPEKIKKNAPPTAMELKLLREEIDPLGYIISRK